MRPLPIPTAILTLALFGAESRAATDIPTSSGGLLRLAEGARSNGESLASGTALLTSGRSLLRRKETITVGPARVKNRGTALISSSGGNAKVTCLEGSTDLFLLASGRQFVSLGPGQMVLIENGAAEMPSPVEIDLSTIHATSALLSDRLPELPSRPAMDRATRQQQQDIGRGLLVESEVSISGESSVATVGGSSASTNDAGGGSGSGSSSSSGGGGGSSGGGTVTVGAGALASHACSA